MRKINTRKTVYNRLVTHDKLDRCNPQNIQLMNDWLEYLISIDRSKRTIYNYQIDLQIFFVWNMENNNNKEFVNLKKGDISRFQSYGLSKLNWSPNRVRRVKSVLSSLSNYIENMLDDEYEDFKPIIRKIENPPLEKVREKTILTNEQLDYLLDELVAKGKYQCACAVALAAYSGSRKSELCRFKVHYFDEANIIEDGALYKTPEKIRTKGRGETVAKPLTKYTLIAFKKYFDLWMTQRKELGIENEWLFVSQRGDEYVQASVSLMDSFATQCSKILDLPFYFHCLRHYLTTYFSKNNIPAPVIQEYFGWSSADMVNVYDDTDASSMFGKFFSKDGVKKVDSGNLGEL